MKEIVETLIFKTDDGYVGDIKPCSVFINQGWRKGAVALTGNTSKYEYYVSYLMPSGKAYVKSLTSKQADDLLEIDMHNSIDATTGELHRAFGF